MKILKALFLAAALAALAGCDLNASPRAEGAAPPPPLTDPDARYQLDAARQRLWVLTEEGLFLHDLAAPRRTPIALPGWVLAGRLHACLPDLALGPRGELVVTSNVIPTLWRIDPATLAVSVHPLALDADTDKDVGFSGLAWSAEQGAYLAVSAAHGSLWRIDPLLANGRKVELSGAIRGACALCVRPPQQALDIDFAPDRRSAYVTVRARAGQRRASYHYVPGGQASCDIS